MINLKELHALATRAVGPHATGFAAQCAADEFSARVFPEDILALVEIAKAFKIQHEGLGEVVKSAEESRDAAVQIQRELINVLPELEGAYRKQNHALAYLRTLANFGGTIEQARALAEKAVKELG